MVRSILCLILFCLLAHFSRAGAQTAAVPASSRVYFSSDPTLLNGYAPSPSAVAAATDALVMSVTGQHSLAAAWRSLILPSDHVGIKISTSGGPSFCTHRSIVAAVLRGLSEAGVPMSQVVVWDRADPEESGYDLEPGGPSIRRIDPVTGYEPKAIITLPITGRLIWGDVDFRPRGPDPLARVEREQYSLDSHWSRLICGLNKIINIPVLSASEDCGIAGCIYNVTVPNVDNWRRFINEPSCGDPFLCELYSDPHAGPKVVLNIMDGMTAQYGGGPDWQPGYSWSHATLYASKDPVAIDSTALRLIEHWRKEAKLPSVTDQARYLRTAATMGLGNYGESQITLVRAGQ